MPTQPHSVCLWCRAGCELRGIWERWVSCFAGGSCRALQHSLTYFLGRYSHTSRSSSTGFLFSSTTYKCLLTNWQWDHGRVPSVSPPRSVGCPLPHLQPALLPLNGCPPSLPFPKKFTAHLSQEEDLLIVLSVSNPSQSVVINEAG